MSIQVDSRRKALLERLRLVSAEGNPLWGTMTAPQMICHLGDQLRVALGDVESRDRSRPLTRTLLKWLVIHLPTPTPKGKIKTVAEMQSTRPATWDDDLRTVEELVERLAVAESPAPHPVFGPLSDSQWGTLTAKHLDHHLRQFGV